MDQRDSEETLRRDIPSFIQPSSPSISNPFMRPRPQNPINLLELFDEDSNCDEPGLVQVFLRLKPCNIQSNLYEIKSDRCLITALDTATAGHGRKTQHSVSKMYTFSHIFGPDAKQKDLFETIVKDNLKKLLHGHSFTLLTYGASGSGKTFTLMGTVAAPGLVPRSLEYLFKIVDAAQRPVYKPADNGAEKLSCAAQDNELQFVKHLRQVSTFLRDKYHRMSVRLNNDFTSDLDISNRTKYYVWVSFVEIYNEGIYDLLSTYDRRSAKLVIREDSNGNVYVKGATQVFVKTGLEAYDVMVAGKQNLQVAPTGVNLHSSRSHCIFTITMLTESDAGCRVSSVRLCDLAGCERVQRTRNAGTRLAESRAINSSLHVLERCLRILRSKQRAGREAIVPYRESKLTRLLGSGLSGARGEAVSVVVTINPAPECAHETRHVLQLAAVARNIQVNNTVSEYSSLKNSSHGTIISNSSEVLSLRTENERLHFELLQAQACYKKLLESMEEKQAESANIMKELVDEAKDMMREYYEKLMQSLRDEMKEMKEDYEVKISEMEAHAPAEVGTTIHNLQNKISQLLTERAILEEKLSAEKLARARVEEELQHLRLCVEDTDDEAHDEVEQDPLELICLSDSEGDGEDPCNESLEPTFKKEDIYKSRVIRQSLFECSRLINKNEENVIDEETDAAEKLNNTIERIDETLGFSDSSKHGNLSDAVNKDTCARVTEDISDREYSEIDMNGDAGANELGIIKEADINNYNMDRRTYSPTEPEIVPSCSKTFKEKIPLRGTYFVRTSQDDSLSNETTQTESDHTTRESGEISEECYNNLSAENNAPAVVSQSLVNKLLQFVRHDSNEQNSDSSLLQYEQLEIAAKNLDSTEQKPFDAFVNVEINKSNKKCYDNNAEERTEHRDDLESEKTKKVYFDNLDIVYKTHTVDKNRTHLKNDDDSLVINTNKMNDTIEAFETIYKETSNPRATEFDLLLSMEMDESNQNKSAIKLEATETKYNLRKKTQQLHNRKEVKADDSEELLIENPEKCEGSGRIKRSLRLRKRKDQVECITAQQEADDNLKDIAKLKDIANLQVEFSDITMDVPAPTKILKDIPSPVKPGEEENLPPPPGVQSCPMKSVTRSRRKLFTPRAELLEESSCGAGDSAERVRVRRPSYHRQRARRKL